MTIGKRIYDARAAVGYTQTVLASMAELTPAAISQIEADEREPSARSLAKLATCLGVSSDFILGIEADICSKRISIEARKMALRLLDEISKATPDNEGK